MVRLPRKISPGARARRAFLADLAIAMAIALFAILTAAGIGVVGFLAALILLALVVWIGVEAVIRLVLRRRRGTRVRRRSGSGRRPSRRPSSLRH